jgi:hypothetical protein
VFFTSFWIIQCPANMVADKERQIHITNLLLNGLFSPVKNLTFASLIPAWSSAVR